MRVGINIAAALAAALIVGTDASAQDGKLDEAASTRVIDGVLQLLDKTYVFPDVAKEMTRSIRDRATRGEYKTLDGPGLARVLTRDLQAVSHDRHLRVEYSVETLPRSRRGTR